MTAREGGVMEPGPCPWCGEVGLLEVRDDSGMRWASVDCGACGARGPSRRLRVLKQDNVESAIRAWNRRTRDQLREALLWHWAAGHNAHDWNDCGEDNDATGPGDIPCRTCAEIADMREAAADEVGRLLGEMDQ